MNVTKNGGKFEINIDNRPVPGKNVIQTSFSGSGKQGIYTENTTAAFDGIIYTMGWDEFDINICSWGSSLKGEKSKGDWSIDQKGIINNGGTEEAEVFKGDLLPSYEFMCQLTGNESYSQNDRESRMGIYPVYIDSSNWLRADLDVKNNQLLVYGIRKGEAIQSVSIELNHRRQIYPKISYSDRYTKTYDFGEPIQISGLDLVLNEPESRKQFSSLDFFYQKEGHWEPVAITIEKEIKKSLLFKMKFNPLVTNKLRIKEEKGEPVPEFNALYANILSKPGYNLRAVKLAEKVIIFIDGKEVMTIDGAWPPSQVGLVSTNIRCSYNGITLFGL